MLRRQVLAVMGLQFGYLMGGSILVETVFTWPGSGFLTVQGDHQPATSPVLQGTILALSADLRCDQSGCGPVASGHGPEIRRALNERVVVAPGADPGGFGKPDGAPAIVVRGYLAVGAAPAAL